MPRSVWMIVVVALFGVYLAWSVSVFRQWVDTRPMELDCGDYLMDPRASWVKLRNCELVMGDAVLESEAGDFERLENRRQGLSTHVYAAEPKWVAAWLPMRAQLVRGGPRAFLRNESVDLLSWVNAMDRATEAQRARMWEDPIILRRMARPGQVAGRAEKPPPEVLRQALGPQASVNVYLVRPGDPEPMVHPSVQLGAALLLLVLVTFVLSKVVRTEPAATTPEEVMARHLVSSTDVKLGELHQLKNEEREARKRR